jgi:nucleoside-diphosphate-sugar epimerase
MARVLIAGCGYVGSALGIRLAAEGHVVWGLRRKPQFLVNSIQPVEADLTKPETLDVLPRQLDFVLYTAATDRNEEGSYKAIYVDGLVNLVEALKQKETTLRRFLFTSSTAVYSQSSGEWVDEESPTEPRHFSGRHLLQGEKVLLNETFPSTVLRLGGIYGPVRTRLIERVRHGEALCSEEVGTYSNRIHLQDCVGALHHLMSLQACRALYLAVDHDPAEPCEVLRWLAQNLGVTVPPVVKTAVASENRSNKRCRNGRLISSGYVFRYPTFREGYEAILLEERHG